MIKYFIISFGVVMPSVLGFYEINSMWNWSR